MARLGSLSFFFLHEKEKNANIRKRMNNDLAVMFVFKKIAVSSHCNSLVVNMATFASGILQRKDFSMVVGIDSRNFFKYFLTSEA